MAIKNAVIESVDLDIGDRGFLQGWLHLNYGGSGQGFGGYALYIPKSFDNHEIKSVAGHFVQRSMEIAGTDKWRNMVGKTIRVDIQDGLIQGIGHIVNDDWFYPKTDFKEAA